MQSTTTPSRIDLDVVVIADQRHPVTRTDLRRLFSKIDFYGPTPHERPELGHCWIWTGPSRPNGYGSFQLGGRGGPQGMPHRVAYQLLGHQIPEGLQLDHLCRNRLCCNPAHLDPVDHRENVRRGTSPAADNARKTHCKNGHEFTPENTSLRTPPRPHGRPGRRKPMRVCKTCHRESAAAYRAALKTRTSDA